MTWRLWRLLRGRYNPPASSSDIVEARRTRVKAELKLRTTRARSGVVDDTVSAFDRAVDVDEFSELIEEAFARKGRQ